LDIIHPDSGWLEVICGPMFSGKSEELIRRLRRATFARRRIQCFKPSLDDRFATDHIVSHNQSRLPSVSVHSAEHLLTLVDQDAEVIGIDESNFFGPDLVHVAGVLAGAGKQVIIAGLDMDYLGRPFPPMPDLLAVAESITKLLAICVRCGAPANHSQRLVSSEDLILTGAQESYEARCRRHFAPGLPQQELLAFVTASNSP
jgi:thymidine kinase